MVWSDNLGRVNGRKGYGAVNRLHCFVVIRGTDGVYLSLNCSCSKQLFPLRTRLVLVVSWASQYVVDGRSGLGREL